MNRESLSISIRFFRSANANKHTSQPRWSVPAGSRPVETFGSVLHPAENYTGMGTMLGLNLSAAQCGSERRKRISNYDSLQSGNPSASNEKPQLTLASAVANSHIVRCAGKTRENCQSRCRQQLILWDLALSAHVAVSCPTYAAEPELLYLSPPPSRVLGAAHVTSLTLPENVGRL